VTEDWRGDQNSAKEKGQWRDTDREHLGKTRTSWDGTEGGASSKDAIQLSSGTDLPKSRRKKGERSSGTKK